jgi:multimeric flavodoxin WrbA
MKIISLLGSPRGLRGNTGRLLRLVQDGAEAAGVQTETLVVDSDLVKPCLGCDTCHKKGVCPQDDGFEDLKDRIMAADGIILASPNYINSVSAQLKAFLDRCCGVIHCLGFEGRYGAAVVTSGGPDEQPIAEYLNRFLITTGIRPVGVVWATMGLIRGKDFPPEIATLADRLGRNLVADWNEKAIRPEVELQMSAFKERMKNLVTYRREDWPFEYDHWHRFRGLEEGSTS